MGHPFSGRGFTFHQPDGEPFQVVGWGDDRQAIFKTPNGHRILKNHRDKVWYFATYDPQLNGLVPGDVRVSDNADPDDPIGDHIIETVTVHKASEEKHEATLSQWQIRLKQKSRRGSLSKLIHSVSKEQVDRDDVVGRLVGLCIPVEFKDVASQFDESQIDDFCNSLHPTADLPHGSVRQYFRDVSGGRLDYINIVTPVFKASRKKSFYTDPDVGGKIRTHDLIKEAINHLKSTGDDLSQLTTENHYIKAVNIFYAGDVQNNWDEGLWPHQGSLAEAIYAGPGYVEDYQIAAMENELRLGTFCHESGHLICDFPDLYNYENGDSGVGRFCLMSHGGDMGEENPTEPCAYLKFLAGWFDDIHYLEDGNRKTLTLAPGDMAFFPKSANEYLIVEHRGQVNRDASLPSSGLAVWHVDTVRIDNTIDENDPDDHFVCRLIQADGHYHLDDGANAGDTSDLFGSQNHRSFPGHEPSQWWDGTQRGLTLSNITSTVTSTTFDVSVDLSSPMS